MSIVANIDAGPTRVQALETLVSNIRDSDIDICDDIAGIHENINVVKKYQEALETAISDVEEQDRYVAHLYHCCQLSLWSNFALVIYPTGSTPCKMLRFPTGV